VGSLRPTHPSLWVATTPETSVEIETDVSGEYDVVVVGGGITGLTTARLLAAEGASVAVVEAGRLGSGVTGYTTAKVTALQRTTVSEIAARHGDERAAVYAAANAAAVEVVARLVTEDGIACAFERASACTYAETADDESAVDAEHAACTTAGLPTRLDSATELSFGVRAAVWLDDQAQFHPREYVLGLARNLRVDGGVVFEQVRALGVEERQGGCAVHTDGGELRAGHVVVATLLPFLDAGGFFARAHPYRSYAMAVRTEGERPAGMYISAGSPTRSIRSTADDWVIIGGEGHKVGHDDDTRQRYAVLEDWARGHFAIRDVGYRWSAQDYESVDGMPYVGPLRADRRRTLVATGFRKWGMTNGTAAAVMLTDVIAGRANPWAEAFDSTRLAPGASIKKLVTENLDVGKRFVADRIRTWRPRPVEELAPGEGDIVGLDGDPVAAFRDDDGTLHAVAASCTHLGCRLAFNTAERSWDCPCHGSRFDVDGHVLQGPAIKDLAPRSPR
jgi:glycine/D-amino acid oxidase-like deaminating enzyme/nitrite reductase/ring-hydroxylating ferredoxin subunit